MYDRGVSIAVAPLTVAFVVGRLLPLHGITYPLRPALGAGYKPFHGECFIGRAWSKVLGVKYSLAIDLQE